MKSIKEIAHLAGVSKSTVSRVITNNKNVSESTRAHVLEIIERYGFQPNNAARTLVTRKTKTLGVVVPGDIGVLFDTSFYFPTILKGISTGATERDYAMLLWLEQAQENALRFSRRIVQGHMMDGVIIVSPTQGHPLIDELIASDMMFVSADRIPRDDVEVNFVTVENVQSSRTAVNHLIKLGRKRIAIIVGDPSIIDSLDRLEGYKIALQDAGIPYDEDLVIIDKFKYESGYNAITRLLENNIEFDGVYASQSTLAVGAVNALLDSGISIPEQVSLIAFDDLADAMYPRMGISTMRQPVLEKGQRLAHALIDIVEGAVPQIQRYLPAELVIRDTCGG